MKLNEVQEALTGAKDILFQLPEGGFVPEHFHVTEIGHITRHFIDCGGKERKEEVINFQLWEADDYNHRLAPNKLSDIIKKSKSTLALKNLEVEVEYQRDTIGRFDLEFNGAFFILVSKLTDCLAKDKCGIPVKKQKVSLADLKKEEEKDEESCCTPGGGCC